MPYHPIIIDPSRPHPRHPRRPRPTPGRRSPRPAGLPCHGPRPASCRDRRHPLVAILALAAAAVLAGHGRSLRSPSGPLTRPSRSGLRWAPTTTAPVASPSRPRPPSAGPWRAWTPLAAAVGTWLAERDRDGLRSAGSRRRRVAVDGKTMRGARAANAIGRPAQLLACMDHTTRAVLAQQQVGDAPEEVPGFARCWPHWTSPGCGSGGGRCGLGLFEHDVQGAACRRWVVQQGLRLLEPERVALGL